jgi:hypothetical protein
MDDILVEAESEVIDTAVPLPPTPADLSGNAVSLARIADRLPAGVHIIRLEKGPDRQWRIEAAVLKQCWDIPKK